VRWVLDLIDIARGTQAAAIDLLLAQPGQNPQTTNPLPDCHIARHEAAHVASLRVG
jgi:hypothetical protein